MPQTLSQKRKITHLFHINIFRSWVYKVLDDFAHCKIRQCHWHLPQPLIQAPLNLFFLTRVCKMCFPSICFPSRAPLWGVAFCTYAGCADKEMDFEWQLWTKTHTIIDRSWTALNIVACPIFRLEWTSGAVFRLHTGFSWTVSHMLWFYIPSKRKLGIAHEHFVTVIQFSYRRVTICKPGQPVWYNG